MMENRTPATTPAGAAFDVEKARFNMVEQQIRPWDVLDQEVLNLMLTVKRESFVPPALQALAFADLELPLGVDGATMLAPKIEARLLQEVGAKDTDKVLEIGTGSGFMAALLGARADEVLSVEINPQLAEQARANLARAGVDNVTVVTGDAALGWAQGAPYDLIVVSASLPLLPPELLAQLKVGGRLVAIVGELPVMEAQLVTCVSEGVYNSINLFETVAAPLQNARQRERFSF
jgi:protein-L-isoaspartate(D-aspartate) O-methyltransferase